LFDNPWDLLGVFKLGYNFSIRLLSRWLNCWVNVVAFLILVFLPVEAIVIWLWFWFLATLFLGGISLRNSAVAVRDFE